MRVVGGDALDEDVMRVAVVCGNPRAKSRTLEAALFVAQRLTETEPEVVLDLVDLGPHLLGWGDPVATEAVQSVQACQVAVVASPTYKGAYPGCSSSSSTRFRLTVSQGSWRSR